MAPEDHELTLSTMAYGGDALGRLDDGRVVFVPFGLPGERVRVRLYQARGHFARGELVEILQTAPERIGPRCKHFGICGGCHYQHIDYETQLTIKREILRDQLVRIGHLESPPVRPAVASPSPWNYRNQVQFHLTRQGKLGYVRARDEIHPSEHIIAIEECHLPEASISQLWPQLEFESDADIERISVRAGSDDDLLLTLESDSPDPPELDIEADISVTHLYDGQSVVVAGQDHVILRVLQRDFSVSGTSFFQVNTALAEKMVQHVLENVPPSPSMMVDAYCGVGLFSAFLAPRCARLIGIESSAAACADYTINLDEFNNVELYEDLTERVLPTLDVKADAVVVDPPRAGLERAALDAIVHMGPGTVVYVSCDPSTLARDAGRLIQGGYRLIDVTPFDLFPQTYHIESISIFER